MKIIPLVLLLGATPVLAQNAQPQAAATPAKETARKSRKAKAKAPAETVKEETAKAEETKKTARRHERVSRRPVRSPRPVVVREAEPKKEEKPQQVAETASQKAPKAQKASRAARGKPAAKPATQPETGQTAEAQQPEKKRGGPFSFIGRMLGGGKQKQEAEQPALVGPPAPTPAPARRQGGGSSRANVTVATEEVDEEATLPRYQRQPQAPPAPAVAVHRTVSNSRGEMVQVDLNDDLPTDGPGSVQVTPPAPEPVRVQQQAPPAPRTPVTSSFDRTRYQETRKKAAEESSVAALGKKLNATVPGAADHAPAARAYTNALFDKMRELDPEQSDWINRMEAATLRRIDAGKPVFAD